MFTQSIEENFLIDLMTTNNAVYQESLTLKLKVDELMNYFKSMDTKANTPLYVIKKVYNKFPDTYLSIQWRMLQTKHFLALKWLIFYFFIVNIVSSKINMHINTWFLNCAVA